MRQKLSCLLVAAFLYSCSLSAQSLYLFKYYLHIGNEDIYYRAFFERDLDGTGFIRVKYHDKQTNQDVMLEMDTEDNYFNQSDDQKDSSILFFTGLYPEVITGDKNIHFMPQVFWFKKDSNTGFYEPWSVTLQDGSVTDEGNFTESKLLTKEDLTPQLAEEFFIQGEGLYENLVDTASVRKPTGPVQKTIKMHVLMVANTDDNSIGTTCIKDKDRTLQSFSNLAEYLGIQIVPTVIYGSNYNKAAVEAALNTLKPDKDDIVVFYYSGHGYNNTAEKNQFPYLDLRAKNFQPLKENAVNIEDIYNSIKQKGARLNLVFSDCCNADPNASSNISSNIAQTRSTSMGWSMNNCRALFMDPKPVSVLMTAATKGELSAGNDNIGGIFTFNFREAMESYFGLFYNNVTWSTVLEQAKKQTINKASHTLCPQEDEKTYKPCNQHPVYKLN